MPRLGPNSGGKGGGRRKEARVVPPGDYLLAMRWFQRRRAKDNTKDYLSAKFEVVAGRLKGESFFAMIQLNLAKQGNVTRWQIWQEAVGNKEEFELGDSGEGTDDEGDANIRRIFLHKPFAAEVVTDTQGRYTNNAIKLFHFRRKWKPQWETWAQEFLAAQAARGNPEDTVDDPDTGQDFGPEEYDQSSGDYGPTEAPPADEFDAPLRQMGDDDDLPPPPADPAQDDGWFDKF
jgi:hypothetical protein